ncbi:hypothetical protein [Orrella sp. 11846]
MAASSDSAIRCASPRSARVLFVFGVARLNGDLFNCEDPRLSVEFQAFMS